MGRPCIDISGQRFGRLVVLSRSPAPPCKDTYWLCRCDCGNETVAQKTNLRSGVTASCGCLQSELTSKRMKRHGLVGTRAYRCYRGMMDRCHEPNNAAWPWYGARGITVCDRWRESIENFVADMGEPPDGMSIDRIDNDKGYSPDNCRWATPKQQMNNRRNTKYVSINGAKIPIRELARALNIHPDTISTRIDRAGWSVTRAISEPVHRCHPSNFTDKSSPSVEEKN